MPFPNFHAARVRRPGDFLRIVVLATLPNDIMVYGGPLKSDPRGSGQEQSFRFPKDKFTEKQARKWMKDHNHKIILFEKAKERVTEAKHSYDRCMMCKLTPSHEVLWAEGHGHAWFCESDLKKWTTNGDGFGEICSCKEIIDRKASKIFAENKNPNIWETIRNKFGLKESEIKYIPGSNSDEQLDNCWRIIANWIQAETQPGNPYKGDKLLNEYTIPTLKEFLKRGKKEFYAENWKDESVKNLFLEAFDNTVKKYIRIDKDITESILSGGIDRIELDREYLVGNFYSLISENKETGFIRLAPAEKIKEENKYEYMIRDFISFKEHKNIQTCSDNIFGDRTELKECLDVTKYKIDELKKLTDKELTEKHSEFQELFESMKDVDDNIVSTYLGMINEMKERKIEYRYKEETDKNTCLDVSGSVFPIKIKYGDKLYSLIETSSKKLILNK